MTGTIPLIAATITLASLPPQGSDAAPPPPLFDSHELLEIRLTADLETLIRDIGKELGDNEYEGQEEHPALLQFKRADGSWTELQVTAETRGGFRRSRDNCDFPPLRLDFRKDAFPKGQLNGTPFEHQNKLKLVTHCQDKRDEYEQFTLQEYLVYRTYNLIEDKSFRVRLARITYLDSAGKRDSLTKFAFFLEDEDLLAARFGGEIFEQAGLHPLDMEYRTMTKLAVFQYMMLNTDWSVSGLHNVKLVGPIQGLVYPVPYDFDWAGVIAPPYAKPDPQLDIRSVRDRRYTGYCRSVAELEETFAVFNRQQEAIYALHRDLARLDPRVLARMLDDYDKFYYIVNRPSEVERTILRQCDSR